MFEGYLIKIGSWPVPPEYMSPESYRATTGPEILADWRDCNNKRHIVYDGRSKSSCRFSTPKNFPLHEQQVGEFREALAMAKTDDGGYMIKFYDFSTGEYRQAVCALDSLDFQIWGHSNDDIFYNPLEFKFSEL